MCLSQVVELNSSINKYLFSFGDMLITKSYFNTLIKLNYTDKVFILI